MKESPKFKLTEVIVITIVSSIIMSLTLGFAVYSNYKRYNINLDDENLKSFITTYNDITSKYYGDVNKEELIDSAINGMLESLDDPYTTFMDENNKNILMESLKGNYEGIGVEILKEDKYIVIKNIFKDSPAEKTGLKINDKIIEINSISIIDKDAEYASNLIKKSEKEVHIKVKREDSILSFKLEKKNLNIPAVFSETLKNDIGYIGITKFSKTSDIQFKEQLDSLKKENIKSLIIDLRTNSGGVLKAASNIASEFLSDSQIIYKLKTKEKTESFKSENENPFSIKIVILVDERTASASEVLAAALKENLNAKLVGVKTFGKGKVQQTADISDGSMIKYTSAYWLTPKGNNIDGKGIKPDYKVVLKDEFFKNPTIENDNQMSKAIELLS